MIWLSSIRPILFALLVPLLIAWPDRSFADPGPFRDVVVQLKWKHQFQFAGYYAAQAKGYYKDAGLFVSFKERTPSMDVTREVLDGQAHFGVGDSELLLSYNQGQPVTAIGAIFQHAPKVLLTRADSGISNPRDLRGKRVMLSGTTSSTLWAMLATQDITEKDITVQDLSWTIDSLVEGKTDAMSAYLTDQPYALKQTGIPGNIMRPLTYGIDFYGDLLFTSHTLAQKNPELVEAFAAATFKGWEYAMKHTDEIIEIIIKEYRSRKSREQLRFEAEAMRELILPQLVEIGTMSRTRWETIGHVYKTLGMMETPPSLDDFIYIPEQQRRIDFLVKWAPWLITLIGFILFSVLALLLFNRRLHKGISDRTQVLDRNRESLRQVLDLVPNMIYAKNSKGQFILLNRAMAVSLNSTVDILTGTHHANVHPNKSELETMEDAERSVFETGVPKVTLAESYQHKDGTTHWLQTTRLPYIAADTGEPAVLVLSVDVTNRRASDAALKASEERFRAIFNQTYQLTGIVGLDGTLLDVNEAALGIYNISREDVLGKPFWETVWWDQDDATHMWLQDCILRAGNGEVIRSETSLQHAPGGEIFLDFSIKPVRNDEGEIIYLISEGRDISNLKRTQQKLRNLNEDLEERVESRTRNLAEAKEELLVSLNQLEATQTELVMSEKLAALGGLVAGVAHEINTPIGVGVTASSFLEEKIKTLSNKFEKGEMKKSDLEKFIATASESSENILTNLNRAAELIKSFKQVAADQSSELPRTFKLKSYVDEILLSLRPNFKRTPHSIVNTCPDVPMYSYPGAFMQIITNLLMNALYHAFEEDEEGRILIGGNINGDTLTLTLSDNGRGIEAERLEKIFEPFYTTKRNRGGTGLGLHIVYNTVTQTLDGSITVESKPGKGTVYFITIPFVQKDDS